MFDHRRDRGAGAVKDAAQIRVNHFRPVVIGHFPDRAVARDARVIHQYIDAMEIFDHLAQELACVLAIGNIALEQLAVASHIVYLTPQFLGGALARPEIHGNSRSAVSKLHSNGTANAARGAGDQGNLAFELPLNKDSGFWTDSNRSHSLTPFFS